MARRRSVAHYREVCPQSLSQQVLCLQKLVNAGQLDLSGKLAGNASFVQVIDEVAGRLYVVSKRSQPGFAEGKIVNQPLPSCALESLAEQTHRHFLFLSFDFVIHLVAETLFLKGRRYVDYFVFSAAGIVNRLMQYSLVGRP
jgi:hypothetical protein